MASEDQGRLLCGRALPVPPGVEMNHTWSGQMAPRGLTLEICWPRFPSWGSVLGTQPPMRDATMNGTAQGSRIPRHIGAVPLHLRNQRLCVTSDSGPGSSWTKNRDIISSGIDVEGKGIGKSLLNLPCAEHFIGAISLQINNQCEELLLSSF